MPGITAHARPWVFEGLKLKTRGGNSDVIAVRQQAYAIGGDQMRHGPSLPDVAVQPQPAIHGVN